MMRSLSSQTMSKQKQEGVVESSFTTPKITTETDTHNKPILYNMYFWKRREKNVVVMSDDDPPLFLLLNYENLASSMNNGSFTT